MHVTSCLFFIYAYRDALLASDHGPDDLCRISELSQTLFQFSSDKVYQPLESQEMADAYVG